MPDASWDVVVANHVLEHVDDRKALPEIRRILVPGGLAILPLPLALTFERTYENTAITSRAEALMVPPLPERGGLDNGP